jgi:hypothetical protein
MTVVMARHEAAATTIHREIASTVFDTPTHRPSAIQMLAKKVPKARTVAACAGTQTNWGRTAKIDEPRRVASRARGAVFTREPADLRGLRQPDDPERRLGAQFQRIAIVVVYPGHDAVQAVQSRHRLHEDSLLPDGTFDDIDERKPELPGGTHARSTTRCRGRA